MGKSRESPIILKFGEPQACLGQRVLTYVTEAPRSVPFKVREGLEQAASHLSIAAAFSLAAKLGTLVMTLPDFLTLGLGEAALAYLNHRAQWCSWWTAMTTHACLVLLEHRPACAVTAVADIL